MRYLYGRPVGEYKDRLEKRLAIAAQGRPFKRVLEEGKKLHPSWLQGLVKNLSIAMSDSLHSTELLQGDNIPSLDTAYAMLGRAVTRKGYIETIVDLIKEIFGNRFVQCSSIDEMNLRCEMEVALVQELIAGLLSKKYNETHKPTESATV